MDSVSVILIVGLLLWGTLGTLVGFQTLRRQRVAAEQNQRRMYLANVGNVRLQQAQHFVEQNGPLVSRPDVDIAVFAQVLRQSIAILREIGDEAAAISEVPGEYSLENVQNLLAAFNVMSDFLERALDLWERKFGQVEVEPSETLGEWKSGAKAPSQEAAAAMKAANSKVMNARRRLVFSP